MCASKQSYFFVDIISYFFKFGNYRGIRLLFGRSRSRNWRSGHRFLRIVRCSRETLLPSHEPLALRARVRGSAIRRHTNSIASGECPEPDRVPERSEWFPGVVLGKRGARNLPPMSFWYVYVLRSAKDHDFYVGSTNNLKRRVQQHQRGENISTAKRLLVELIYFEGHHSKDDALRREKYFKTTKGRITLRQMLRGGLGSNV